MIETYKLLTNKEGISRNIFFKMRKERGNPELYRGLVIFKKRTTGRLRRKYTFSQRVVNPWNKLRREEVQAIKTSNFKAKFDANEMRRRIDRRNLGGNRTLFQRLYVWVEWSRRFLYHLPISGRNGDGFLRASRLDVVRSSSVICLAGSYLFFPIT